MPNIQDYQIRRDGSVTVSVPRYRITARFEDTDHAQGGYRTTHDWTGSNPGMED
jgi:hypothetical protein